MTDHRELPIAEVERRGRVELVVVGVRLPVLGELQRRIVGELVLVGSIGPGVHPDRDADLEGAVVDEDASGLGERVLEIVEVLENVAGEHALERGLGKRLRLVEVVNDVGGVAGVVIDVAHPLAVVRARPEIEGVTLGGDRDGMDPPLDSVGLRTLTLVDGLSEVFREDPSSAMAGSGS